MFKFIRFIFFMLLVITGLYFFGDFRINDTNVKDYLRTVITAQNVKAVTSKVQSIFNTIQKLINEFDDDVKFEDNQPIKTLEVKPNTVSNTTSSSTSEPTKPQEKVFKHEKDKIIDLIQSNINQPSTQEP